MVTDWQSAESAIENECNQNVYVLRDRRCLSSIDQWLRGKASEPSQLALKLALLCWAFKANWIPDICFSVDIMKTHPLALVPIRLDAQTSGRPLRLALICATAEEDFRQASVAEGLKKKIEEPKQSLTGEATMEVEPEVIVEIIF